MLPGTMFGRLILACVFVLISLGISFFIAASYVLRVKFPMPGLFVLMMVLMIFSAIFYLDVWV